MTLEQLYSRTIVEKRLRYQLVCLAFICLCTVTYAQQDKFQFTSISSTDSTTLGKITAIAQDQRGFIWMVDQDAKNIIRYDGKRMLRFGSNPSDSTTLSDGSNLESLCADMDGNIWLGSGSGIDKIDSRTNQVKHFQLRHDNKDVDIHSIIQSKDGWIWAGSGNGLYALDPKTGAIKQFTSDSTDKNSLSSDMVWVVYEDRQGTIWAGCGFPFYPPKQGGLNRFDRKTGRFTRYLHDSKDPKSLANDNVSAICEDSHGNFWVGTGGDGLHKMNREQGTFEHFYYQPDHPEALSRPPIRVKLFQDFISFIREDATGRLWIGTTQSGLTSYDPISNKATHHYGSNGYPDSSAFACFSSKEGMMWIASQWSSKLYKYDPYRGPNLSWTPNPGFTTIVYEDQRKNIWVGKGDSVFYIYAAGDTIRPQIVQMPLTKANLPTRYTLNDVLENNPESYWLATSDGIFDFNPVDKNFRRIDHDPGNHQTYKAFISSMTTNSKGERWFTTAAGLYYWDPKTGNFSAIQPDENDSTKLRGNGRQVLEYPAGVLWIPIFPNFGIDRMEIETKRVKHYFRRFGVNHILVDSKGVLWASTQRGVYYYNSDTDQFVQLTGTYSELETVEIRKGIEDDNHNLWFTSASNIFRLDSSRKLVLTLGRTRGLRYNGIALGLAKTKDGRILIGADGGYYSMDPTEAVSNMQPPVSSFLNFYVDNRLILPGNGVLKKDLNETNQINLAYNQSNFAISYMGFHYSDPSQNKSYFKLENYDLDWREFGMDTMAAYFKVPAGSYVFKVRTITSQGVWNEKSIHIKVNPPWWLSWWAYVLYAIGFVVTALFIYRDEKKKIIVKEREKTRERELEQAKEIEKAYHTLKETQAQLVQSEKMASLGELTAGIAHEIQNPLNFVNNFSELNRELIQDMNMEIDKGNLDAIRNIAKDIAANEEKITEHGKRADSIVKGMLQHSRVSSGIKEPTDINALCDEYLRLCFHGLRAKDKSFNAHIETHFDVRIPKLNVVPQDLGRVLLNICNNAFYAVNEKRNTAHKDYQPTVKLSTKLIQDRFAEIRIEDNGNGIPAKVRDKIFQPFFTTKPAGQGTGLGLSLSYDIVKAHGGEISVESKEQGGTEFLIRIPVS